MCLNLKNNNEHLPFDHWEVRSSTMRLNEHDRLEWNYVLRWMVSTSLSCLMDACFSVSALMQRLRMNIGIRLCNESYTGLCRNVTQVVTWPIISYGGAGGKSPSRAAINRLGKKNSIPIDLIFGLMLSYQYDRTTTIITPFQFLTTFPRKI